MKHVKCKSGMHGWSYRLQENYSSYREFSGYCRMYAIHTRIGYSSMKQAWKDNPIMRGSVLPSDLQRFDEKSRKWVGVSE